MNNIKSEDVAFVPRNLDNKTFIKIGSGYVRFYAKRRVNEFVIIYPQSSYHANRNPFLHRYLENSKSTCSNLINIVDIWNSLTPMTCIK